MASSLTNCFVLLAAVSILTLTRSGFGVRIRASPQSFDQSTEALNITCYGGGDAYWARSVVAMAIKKQDVNNSGSTTTSNVTNGGAIKHLVHMDNTAGVSMGRNSRPYMKAYGKMDKDENKCFLRLVVQNPGVGDAGTYKCQLFYFDEKFQLKEAKVVTNVYFQEGNIKDIVEDLRSKVAGLEKSVEQQKDTISRQELDIADLKQAMTKLNKTKSDSQNEEVEKMKKESARQRSQIKNMIRTLHGRIMKEHELSQRLEAHLEQHARIEETDNNSNESDCPDGWSYYKGYRTCLKVFGENDQDPLEWFTSGAFCQRFGAHLVQIRDKEKNDFVYDMVANMTAWPWIGLVNMAKQGYYFQYVDGSPLGTYQPWRTGKPQGYPNGDIHCVFMDTGKDNPGQWTGSVCSLAQPFVCSIQIRTPWSSQTKD